MMITEEKREQEQWLVKGNFNKGQQNESRLCATLHLTETAGQLHSR